ncbi:hypothetical protein DDZ14_18585 [Maritimibacter sp. 55A14]|nr:hypothetical protein DDZ14_18585 [Maritimibacter sp. 55A14]
MPEFEFTGFCGAIWTDAGTYELPDNFYRVTVHQSRQELDRRLREGCRFKVLILGFGKKFEPGDKPRAPIRQTISRILEEYGCEEPGRDTPDDARRLSGGASHG